MRCYENAMAMRRRWNPAEAEVRCYKNAMAMRRRWNRAEAEVNQSSSGDAMMRRLMVLGARRSISRQKQKRNFFGVGDVGS